MVEDLFSVPSCTCCAVLAGQSLNTLAKASVESPAPQPMSSIVAFAAGRHGNKYFLHTCALKLSLYTHLSSAVVKLGAKVTLRRYISPT